MHRVLVSICVLFGSATAKAQESGLPKAPVVGVATRRVPEGLNFANGLFRQRRFELAAEEYERFLKSNPASEDANDAQFGLANARLFQQRYQDAQTAFRRFLELAPNHPRAQSAWYRLGEVGYLLGDLEESRRALEKFRAGSPSHSNFETAWTYLGDVCYALKDLQAAKEAYENGLASFPQGSLVDRTRYGLGRSLAGLNQREAALKIFEELASTGKRDWVDRARLQIGIIHLAEKRYDRALSAFQTLERESPNSLLRPEAQVRAADAFLQLKRLEDALPLLRSVAEDPAQPLGPQAALTMATVQLEKGQTNDAVATLQAALKRFSTSTLLPSLGFRLGEALERLKRPDEATAQFLRIAEIFPKDPLAEPALFRALSIAEEARDFTTVHKSAISFLAAFPASASSAVVRLIDARAFMVEKRSREAIPILELVLNESPKGDSTKGPLAKLTPQQEREARYDLALAYRENDQKDKADALLRKLATISNEKAEEDRTTRADSIGADAQFLVGQAELESGKFAEAVGPLEAYLKTNPNGELADLALSHLTAAQLGAGQIDAAEKTLGQLETRFPKSQNLPAARLRLAEAALEAKKYELSERHFRTQPTPIDPKQKVRIQVGLGQALWNLKKPLEAAAAYGEALEAAPDDPSAPEIAMARARALDAAGRSDQALEAYTKVVSQYAKSERVLSADLARARLLSKLGKPAEASKIYEAIFADRSRLDRAASEGFATDQLLADWGWALIDSGKTWDADRVFDRLLKEFPESAFVADARLNLAESANSAHNHAEVIRLLKPLTAPEAKVPDRLLPPVLYRLGRAYIETGDWQGAGPILDRLIQSFPDSPLRREARLFRAEVALQSADAAGAKTQLSTLLTEVEGKQDSHSKQFNLLIRRRMVQTLLNLKAWDEVLAQADTLKPELARDDPALAEIDFARGRALQGLARLDEARAAYQSVIEARKGGGELAAQARFMRGETYFHENKLGEARREFLMVDTLHPDAPKWQAAALLEAGKVYERLEQWTEASNYFQSLITRFPDDPHAKDAKTRLESARKRSKDAGRAG